MPRGSGSGGHSWNGEENGGCTGSPEAPAKPLKVCILDHQLNNPARRPSLACKPTVPGSSTLKCPVLTHVACCMHWK